MLLMWYTFRPKKQSSGLV